MSNTIIFQNLEQENEALKKELLKSHHDLMVKNIERRELIERASSATSVRSFYDLQVQELKYVSNHINELMQKAEAAAQREAALEKELSGTVSTAHQLEDIRSSYNHLQVQLDDLSARLQQLNAQHIMQLPQTSRIAELESLLANAEAEIELLKNPPEEGSLP